MPNVTLLFGVLLILLGAVGYFGTGRTSATALIPAAFGAALVLLGLISRRDRLRKHAMHVASAVGLLGVVGAVIRPIRAAVAGELVVSAAVAAQLLMALLCAVYLALCVRSFIQARRRP